MYDRLYTFFTENKTIFERQFSFRAGHSTNHALLELINQICERFEEKKNFKVFFFFFFYFSKTFNIEKYGM